MLAEIFMCQHAQKFKNQINDLKKVELEITHIFLLNCGIPDISLLIKSPPLHFLCAVTSNDVKLGLIALVRSKKIIKK